MCSKEPFQFTDIFYKYFWLVKFYELKQFFSVCLDEIKRLNNGGIKQNSTLKCGSCGANPLLPPKDAIEVKGKGE